MRRPVALALTVTAAASLAVALPAAGSGPEPLEHLQWSLPMIHAPEAWAAGATGAGVKIAVIDDGIDGSHPEYAGRLVDGASFWGCPGQSGLQPAAEPCTGDEWGAGGHGTHVAGIAAAPRNGVGVVGVAPDAMIMPVRAIGSDGAQDLLAVPPAIRYAVDHGADVLNLSLGWIPGVHNVEGQLDGWADALRYALDHDVTVVMAAGNDGAPLCANEFGIDGVICVGSVGRDGTHADYSNFGYGVDVVAPGGSGLLAHCDDGILSAVPMGNQASPCNGVALPEGYNWGTGTSMATPQVAGVAALLAQKGVRGVAAAHRIEATADDIGPAGPDPLYGAGLVDAAAAVSGL